LEAVWHCSYWHHMSDMQVYVITNESFDGWVKVGKTTDINKRLCSYSTGAPTTYVVEYINELYDDRPVHDLLDAKGIERSGEWFKCEPSTAIDAVRDAASNIPDYVQRVLDREAEDQGEIVFT